MTLSDQNVSDLTTYAGTWILDPARTSVEFHTKAMWVVKVKGTVKAIEGRADIGSDGTLSGTLVLDATSFDTHNKKRDAHLQTEDFFEVVKYPTIVFAATSARPVPSGQVELTGSLTIHGQSRPLTVLASVNVTGGQGTVDTEVDIDRSDWGMSWSKMGAGLANHLVIKAHFVKE
jgi:polyisoprenoid-binding protein YceI